MGFGSGLALARFASVTWLRSARVQGVSGALAALLVLAAWTMGLLARG